MSKCRIHLEFIARANWNHLLFEHTLQSTTGFGLMMLWKNSGNHLIYGPLLFCGRAEEQGNLFCTTECGLEDMLLDTIRLYASNKE